MNTNVAAPRKAPAGPISIRRRNQYIPTVPAAVATNTAVAHAQIDGSRANSQLVGEAAPAFHPASRGVPLQIIGSHQGRWPLRSTWPTSTRKG